MFVICKSLILKSRLCFAGRCIDTSLFNLVTYILNRYPFLRAPPHRMRTTTKHLLHGNQQRGWVTSVAVTAVFVAGRPLVWSLRVCSLWMRLWSWIASKIAELLNDGGMERRAESFFVLFCFSLF